MLVRKVAAGPAKATLDFIQNEQRAVRLGKLARGPEEFWGKRVNATFPLDCLQTHGAYTTVEVPLQVINIVQGDERHARHQRGKRLAILRLPGGCESAERPSMKRIVQRQHPPFGFVAVAVLRSCVSTREFQRSLPSLSTAVAKECAIEFGEFGQPPGQLCLILMKEEI